MKLSKKDNQNKRAAQRDFNIIQRELDKMETKEEVRQYLASLATNWTHILDPVKDRTPVEKPDWDAALEMIKTKYKSLDSKYKTSRPLMIQYYDETEAKNAYERYLAGEPGWYVVK